MSEEEILENLKKYLQFLLDNGTHKIFYNDLFWCEKTIDCINAINDLQQENKQLKEQLDQALKDYDEELTKRYKVMHYIEQLPFNDLIPLEVKVIYKILRDKE